MDTVRQRTCEALSFTNLAMIERETPNENDTTCGRWQKSISDILARV